MASDAPAGVAGRLLALATAAMPPSRRDWGRAMSAELPYARTGGERARLVLGAARVALLPPVAIADYRRTIGRSAALAVIAYVPLGIGLYASNVVFQPSQDSTAAVLVMSAYLVITLMAAGALARRASPRRGAAVLAGIAVGLVLAILGMATFAAIDNAFLSIVSHRPGSMAAFRASGLGSMRAYVNAGLEATAPGVTAELTVLGVIFAPIGAALADRVTFVRPGTLSNQGR